MYLSTRGVSIKKIAQGPFIKVSEINSGNVDRATREVGWGGSITDRDCRQLVKKTKSGSKNAENT